MTDDLCQCPKCGRMHRHLQAGQPPKSIMEQIAHDIREGTFPQKSEQTLREERPPDAWLVGWHRANGEAGLSAYVNEDDARRAAKNLEAYSASETMTDVQPLYAH